MSDNTSRNISLFIDFGVVGSAEEVVNGAVKIVGDFGEIYISDSLTFC